MSDSTPSTAEQPNVLQRYQAWRKRRKEKRKNKPAWKEWRDSIVFALTAAVIIRTFFFEAYVIPTGSMERSLLVGDFLFVSKLSYGPRLPMAPLSLPLVHNKIPGTETKSYLDWITFGYARMGSGDVDRNDPFVFNYPVHDIDNIRNPQFGTVDIPSMKENYIKRAVAIAGDKFEIRAGDVYINGQRANDPPDILLQYHVVTKNEQLGAPFMTSLDYSPQPKSMQNPNSNWQFLRSEPGNGADSTSYFHHYFVSMPTSLVPKFKALGAVVTVERLLYPKGVHMFEPDPTGRLDQLLVEDSAMLARAKTASKAGNVPQWSRLGKFAAFPHAKQFPWNLDWFGPITIPKEGVTVKLTLENLPLYARIIDVYEDHDLQVSGDKILIDGQPATSYTFEMDYYFAMGDNRYNSEDSRYWGFVPENHVIGKPMFVGLNWQKRNRFFKGID